MDVNIISFILDKKSYCRKCGVKNPHKSNKERQKEYFESYVGMQKNKATHVRLTDMKCTFISFDDMELH